MPLIDITLPDASVRQIESGSSAYDLAASIGPRLAQAAVAAKVDGELKDLGAPLTRACRVEILTFKAPESLEILRHSTAHLLAAAVQELFPGTKVTIGPAIDNGFYYDFDMPKPATEDDLPAIEKRMAELAAKGDAFTRSELSAEEASAKFEKMGESYKVEIIRDLKAPTVSCYRVGGFDDLCRGPHIHNSRQAAAFKLLSVAGAYWRGDERNKMLTRIYGTAFATQAELDAHLKQVEEAKKRDHRRLGKDLDLFSFQEEAGPGLVYWHPKGAMVRKLIEDFWRDEHMKAGYDFVYSPHIGRAHLWETSGHLENYKESMYNPMQIDEQDYYIKPMNCPFHILMYRNSLRSYRDLPMRMAELGTVYRYERSGTLQGLMRVRGFTQDDSHIFVTEEMLDGEITRVVKFIRHMLTSFGFSEFEIFVSTRPKDSVGTVEWWDKATSALKRALEAAEWPYQVDEGGGAFYGPKIDFKIKDSIGRTWQCSTLQVDPNLPERFKLEYVAADGTRKRPIMLHRALLGSLERFFGILVEHYAGAFPLWLAPVQVRILTITADADPYAAAVLERLRREGFRVETDLGSDKINAKVRQAQLQKIPFSLVLGRKEAESGQVAIRRFGAQDSPVMDLEAFVALLKDEVLRKAKAD
ncbi:MAG TPA: threonine--tRNA ligase [bacterium]|jgi:threonyl-tRNA synthetase|nr:threonine--tRNA ligase [bacterium]